MNVIRQNKILFEFQVLIEIFYCRATAIAPIKATKRIIEISSNGRKNLLINEFQFVDYYLENLAL